MYFDKTQFIESEAEFPEKVVGKFMESFSIATEGLAELRVSAMGASDRIIHMLGPFPFQFDLSLSSPYLAGYSYEVLYFGYDLSLYPVTYIVNGDIASSVGINTNPFLSGAKLVASSEQDFTKSLEEILSCAHFRATVGGLMKIARNRS